MSNSNQTLRIGTLAIAVFISACVLAPRETNTPRVYFLDPEITPTNPHGPHERVGTSNLLITTPRAQAGFDTARMAYLLRPYEINYYGFNQWADTPGRLLHRIMVETLDKSGLWSAVLQTPSAIPTQYRLDCDNLVLEQQFFARPSRVRLALRAQIVETKNQSILGTRYFELLEVAPSDDPYGGVMAANRTAAKFLAEMTEWLEIVMRDTK